MKLLQFLLFFAMSFSLCIAANQATKRPRGDSAERKVEMKSHATFLAAAALVVAATFSAAPAFAATQKGQPTQVSREQALHDCNQAAAGYSDTTWESTKSATYATCMTLHGQQP
jgi:hypothetical protein